MSETARSPVRTLAVCGALVVLVWLVFGRTLGSDFVNYDDNTYVYGNSLTRAGLSWSGLMRAFADTHTDNWHPLTLISHMIDCQLFGLKPGGHHFTNVLLHTIAVLLLFAFLRKTTARFWSSAFVAALFAIHPLRVESVAWIAERKDVLSGVFFFLTLISYADYVITPSLRNYIVVAIAFALGLMSKPMLVTTPAVLLLLDYWPLNRGHTSAASGQKAESKRAWKALIVEKLPLFAMSAAASIVAIALQVHSPIGQLPLLWRLENALVTSVTYIWQIFWPANLAVFYPYPDGTLAFWQIGLASVVLIAITMIAVVFRKTRPYLLVGWLWYLIMLLPVIGIIEVGLQGHADRYTYLPHIGLYIALAWLIADLSISLPARRQILATVSVLIVTALSVVAWKQTTYWRNTESLWTHTLAVTTDNDVALNNLGNYYMEQGRLDDALSHLERALAVHSESESEHYTLSLAVIHATIGEVLTRIGRLDEALNELRQATNLRPDFPDAH